MLFRSGLRKFGSTTMPTLPDAKREIRKIVKGRLQALSTDDAASQSRIVTQKIKAMPEYQQANRVGIYLSMPASELSTNDIVVDALNQGKSVYVPYLHKAADSAQLKQMSKMAMLKLHSKADLDSLKRDSWGIPTLDPGSIPDRENAQGGFGLERRQDEVNKGRLDLILVPGMAFDRERRRLGHGKGFYDRFLWEYKDFSPDSRNLEMPILVALAFREQILDPDQQIPVAQHDWSMDAVVSADEVIRASPRGLSG